MRNIDVDKEIYQNIFDAYVGEMLVMDNEGYILLANPACEKLFGYESGELEG